MGRPIANTLGVAVYDPNADNRVPSRSASAIGRSSVTLAEFGARFAILLRSKAAAIINSSAVSSATMSAAWSAANSGGGRQQIARLGAQKLHQFQMLPLVNAAEPKAAAHRTANRIERFATAPASRFWSATPLSRSNWQYAAAVVACRPHPARDQFRCCAGAGVPDSHVVLFRPATCLARSMTICEDLSAAFRW